MLDLSYFQNSGNVNTQTFTNAGTWVTWVKPRGAKFVNILCIGSGGGGVNGVSSSASVRGAGGSGGGAGGIVRAQFQASVLPDVLYVYTGVGGPGSLGGSQKTTADAAQNGERSFVGIIPDTSSASNIVVTSGALSARGGGVASTNSAGAGETIATTSNAVFLNLGTFIAVAGTAGAAGSGNVAAANITPSQITTGGTGGSGNATAGGFVAAGIYPAITGLASQAGAGTKGADGRMFTKPVLAYMGGQGGGGAGTGAGGKGGDGSWGCGGGGGGGCQNIGGDGGRGGDGIIIITTSF